MKMRIAANKLLVEGSSRTFPPLLSLSSHPSHLTLERSSLENLSISSRRSSNSTQRLNLHPSYFLSSTARTRMGNQFSLRPFFRFIRR